MRYENKDTLDKILTSELKEITWPSMTAVFTNIAILGKNELQEKQMVAAVNDQTTIDYLMSIFDSLDEQYHLIEKLDELIDFKKIFGKFLGSLVEKIDTSFIRAIIKYIIFPLILSFFSRKKILDNNVNNT